MLRKLLLAASAVALLTSPASAQILAGQIFNPVTPVGPNGAAISSTNPLQITGPVTVSPAAAVPSGTSLNPTVTLGGTYQTVLTASTARKGCTIQNPTTATEVLNVRVASVAVFTLPIGATFNCGMLGGGTVSDLIEVTAATTAHAFSVTAQ